MSDSLPYQGEVDCIPGSLLATGGHLSTHQKVDVDGCFSVRVTRPGCGGRWTLTPLGHCYRGRGIPLPAAAHWSSLGKCSESAAAGQDRLKTVTLNILHDF